MIEIKGKKKFIRRLAGTVAVTGFLGGWFVNEYLYLIDLFLGINMIQSSFTDFCPPETFYERYLS